MKSQEIQESREMILKSQNDTEFCDYIQSQIRLMLLLVLASVAVECGPAGIRKDMEDIPPKEEIGVTAFAEKPIEYVQVELKRILPPDELDIFEKYSGTENFREKIDLGLYFVSKYPYSLVTSRIRLELKETETQLWSTINHLLDSAKANPDDFLSKHVVDSKEDGFLASAILFVTRFPHNPNREAAIQLIQEYIEIMGYSYIEIDAADQRLAHQDAVKPGEKAFAKFYQHLEHWQNYGVKYIWEPAKKTDIYKWVVVSVDGKRVGVSSIMNTTEQPSMWVETFVSLAGATTAVTESVDIVLQEGVKSGLFIPQVLEEYRGLGTSADSNTGSDSYVSTDNSKANDALEQLQGAERKQKKGEECRFSCKRNWVDTCGHGLHTLLPGENYTPKECDDHYHDCLDVCDYNLR